MLPANWVRPRFRTVATGVDLYEIRIHSPVEANDLVAYTKRATWYLPRQIWAGSGGAGADGGFASGTGLANNAAGTPVTVTIRGVSTTAPGTPIGVTGDFNIAPVNATGSVVFWTASSPTLAPQASRLYGFSSGDEGVESALTLSNLQWTGQIGEDGAELRGYYDSPKLAGFTDGQVRCVGCHAPTPDGQAVVFTDSFPWPKGASVLGATPGAVPSFIGAGAQAVMKMPWWGTQTMSPGHFKAGDRTLVTSYGTTFKSGMPRNKPWQALPTYNTASPLQDDFIKWHQLAWIDLESTAAINVAVTDSPDYGATLTARQNAAAAAQGTAWGLIATGDTGLSDVTPSLSHGVTSAGAATGVDSIVYVATDYSPDGHPDYLATTADIRTVAFNKRAGGTSAPLAGASSASYLEYDPSYSPDDKLIAFTRAPVPAGSGSPDGPYYNRNGLVMVIPAGGGTATRLAANDPNTCAGDASSAIINSYLRWSPDAVTDPVDGKTYYFLLMSSARKYGDEFSSQFQLPADPTTDFTGLHTSSQLYLVTVVVDQTGAITSYPAVYLWNQNRAAGAGGAAANLQYSNLTPAWARFNLPPLQIAPVADDPAP
jgi:hypothetical protein